MSDDDKREADLRLDVRGEHFDGKEIIHRIATTDAVDVMSPRSSPNHWRLRNRNSERWIAPGAKYEQHWSFARINCPKFAVHDILPLRYANANVCCAL